MSNLTLKQALSALVSKFRQSGSEESSSFSSDEPEAEEEAPLSPLALKDESTPEGWLSRFLTVAGVSSAGTSATVGAAARNPSLVAELQAAYVDSWQHEPRRYFESGYLDNLKASDWPEWWRAQETLGRFAYSALSLAMLGQQEPLQDVVFLQKQSANPRIAKDAQLVVCYLLGKDWPGGRVTEADMDRLLGKTG